MKKLIKVSSASLALLSIFFIASCGDEAINTSSIIEDIEKGNFVWNEDNSASYVYKTANGEELTVTAKITSNVIKDATCIDEGQREYKAEVEVLGKTYSDSKIITIPATGHSYYPVGELPPTCDADGHGEYIACENCDKVFDPNYGEIDAIPTIPATGHTMEHYDRVEPTHLASGHVEYNQCTSCGKYYDMDGNEITDVSIPALSKEISLAINSDKYALTLVEDNENAIQWKLEASEVKVGDAIKLFLKDGSEYSFYNMDGIDDDYKVTVDATDVTFNVVATPNGVAISLEYETEEKGIFVEVTNESGVTLYPMSEINYNFGTETNSYVYGYISLLVGDKVLIKDTINDKTYGYDDILESEIWRSHYFTCGDNGEIIINTTDRVGFEFSRNGDEKLTLAFVHDPVTVTSMEVAVKGEVDTAPLTKNTISEDSNEYGYALHVLNHESTVNASDIKEYILANGYIVYQIELPISAPMSICLKDNSGNTYGYSVFESKYSSSDFTYSNDEGYIHLETSGTYVIMFIPSCGNITISFAPASASSDAYYMTSKESSFTGLTKDSNNIVTVSNIDFDKNGYIAFTDSSYNMLTVTLDTTTDFIVSSTLLMCTKAGKYTLTLNLDTLVVHVDVVEYVTLTGLVDGAAINLGSYSSKTFKRNASNEAEVVAEGMVITAANQRVAIMDPNGEGVTDITVASDSSSLISLLAAGSYFLVFAETGTYNIYVNEDTHVVRVV
ncbi:MAG: hypothetical protein II508_01220, partial [Acholeplasmatales bacterium]|nr:hypothetical protein [Acholeplasmatales bacterium]